MEDYLQKTISTYNSMVVEYVKDTRDRQPKQEFEAFCQVVKPRGVILDAGCGWGRDCQDFAKRNFTAIGIDLSKEMLKLARKFAPTCTFVQADLRHIPYKDASFDGIWCCASLLHLERSQVVSALKEFKRIAKKDAICCILVKEGKGEEMAGISQEQMRFFTYFQAGEMHNYCLDAGLRILDQHISNGKSTLHQNQQKWLFLLTECG